MKDKIINNWSYIFITIFLLIAGIYVGINGENIIITIHDNLDSNIPTYKMISDNNLFWNFKSQIPFLSGLDRIYLYSYLKAYDWLYMILPTFWAFVFGWFIKIIISVFGFIFLGKVLKLDNTQMNKNIIVFCGFLYGIIPTFPTSAFEFASLPFLLALIIKFYKEPKFNYAWLFLIYPIFSEIVLFGIFILGYILLFTIIDAIVTKKIKWYMLIPIVSLSLGFIISEWSLFYLVFSTNTVTIRESFIPNYLNFYGIIKTFFIILINGHRHVSATHVLVVMPVCFLLLVYTNFKYIKNKQWKNILSDKYNWLIFLIIFNTISCGLQCYKPFKDFIALLLPPIANVDISRAMWFNPFLWYLAFAIALIKINMKNAKISDFIKFILCILAFFAICYNNNIYNSIKQNYDYQRHIRKHHVENNEITYADFYSVKLFEKIKKQINYNNEWSVAFGMHPSILQYSGIHTLDGYCSYYPLEYKKKFRELIEPDLQVDEFNRNFYDTWGARAYIYSKDVYFFPVKKIEPQQAPMLINPKTFKELNGKYVFSRVIITNAKSLNMDFVGKFEDESSPYTIYVYKAK